VSAAGTERSPGGAFFTAEDHYFHMGYLTDQRADDDAAEVLALLDLAPGARILDAGCGDGRLALRFAALGYRVVAVDHDPEQISRLEAATRARGDAVEAVCAPLAAFTPTHLVDAAVLWFTTWGFLDDEQNEQVLEALGAAVVDGGALVIDTLNPGGVKRYVDVHPEEVVTERGGNRQIDRYSFDGETGRLRSQRVVEMNGTTKTRSLSLSLPTREAWGDLLGRHGFELTAVTARGGATFEPHSWEMVITAHRLSRAG
jgi:SAM-dependent methyltransferase